MAYPYTVSAPSTGLDFAKLAEQYGKLTVREITSGTSGLALAQLVAARAANSTKLVKSANPVGYIS
jgi:hypothetical protein